MLKSYVDFSGDSVGQAQIETSGEMSTLLAELTYLVVALYQSTKKADEEAGWLFKSSFVDALNDESVWNLRVHGRGGKDSCIIFKDPRE